MVIKYDNKNDYKIFIKLYLDQTIYFIYTYILLQYTVYTTSIETDARARLSILFYFISVLSQLYTKNN